MNHKKEILDLIIETNKGEPVGGGYIDIIVSREFYKNLITDLVKNNFKITAISWWEWCPEDNAPDYGMGGPKSKFLNGWFSEIGFNLDYTKLEDSLSKEQIIKKVLNIIESKELVFPSKTVDFQKDSWLTPAIWLEVPEEWKNNHS